MRCGRQEEPGAGDEEAAGQNPLWPSADHVLLTGAVSAGKTGGPASSPSLPRSSAPCLPTRRPEREPLWGLTPADGLRTVHSLDNLCAWLPAVEPGANPAPSSRAAAFQRPDDQERAPLLRRAMEKRSASWGSEAGADDCGGEPVAAGECCTFEPAAAAAAAVEPPLLDRPPWAPPGGEEGGRDSDPPRTAQRTAAGPAVSMAVAAVGGADDADDHTPAPGALRTSPVVSPAWLDASAISAAEAAGRLGSVAIELGRLPSCFFSFQEPLQRSTAHGTEKGPGDGGTASRQQQQHISHRSRHRNSDVASGSAGGGGGSSLPTTPQPQHRARSDGGAMRAAMSALDLQDSASPDAALRGGDASRPPHRLQQQLLSSQSSLEFGPHPPRPARSSVPVGALSRALHGGLTTGDRSAAAAAGRGGGDGGGTTAGRRASASAANGGMPLSAQQRPAGLWSAPLHGSATSLLDLQQPQEGALPLPSALSGVPTQQSAPPALLLPRPPSSRSRGDGAADAGSRAQQHPKGRAHCPQVGAVIWRGLKSPAAANPPGSPPPRTPAGVIITSTK